MKRYEDFILPDEFLIF